MSDWKLTPVPDAVLREPKILDAHANYKFVHVTRLEHLEKKADATFQCVIILGVAQLVTLIALGVFAARLGL